jgi:hypothetical protein
MKQERVILSFVMVLIGLLVAGAAFYLYQSSKVVSSKSTVSNLISPTPTPKPSVYLSITSPDNEIVVGSKTLNISGKAPADATILVITDSDQLAFKPSSQGDFSTTITLGDGINLINIAAISPNGEITSVKRTVTYSTESF